MIIDAPEALSSVPPWEQEALSEVGLQRDVVMNYVLWAIQQYHHHDIEFVETMYMCLEDDIETSGETLTDVNAVRLDQLIEHYIKVATELYTQIKLLLDEQDEDSYMSIQMINPYHLIVGIE